jgi:predicted RNA-binding Zn-ribbon protein involved in translation (DUF1610 family)
VGLSGMLLERFFPETRGLQRPRERSQVAVQALRMLGLTGPCGFALGAVLVIPSVLLASELNRALRAGYGVHVSSLLVFATTCIGVQTVWAVAIRRSVRRRVREELNTRGLPVCTACGYNLTGNVTGTCPECGQLSRRPLGGSGRRRGASSKPDLG